ncbi:hypothetical protein L6R50_01510 [Myxococcota bacterium]|nr:hypothetical protein [Myxococcota bacterium]
MNVLSWRGLAALALATVSVACGRGEEPTTPAAAVPKEATAVDDVLPQGAVQVALLYSGNVDGDTEPCG